MDSKTRGRLVLLAVAVVAAGLLLSGTASADLRIRTVDVYLGEESVSDLLVTRSAVRVDSADSFSQILLCTTGDMILLGPPNLGLYWRGSVDELINYFESFFARVLASVPPEAAQLLGAGGAPPVDLRIIPLGEDVVAGYPAVGYRVQYNDGSGWQTLEQVWISEQLMREIEAEAGDCLRRLMEFQVAFSKAVMMFVADGSLAASLHPEYTALITSGFPVRNVSETYVFGFPVTVQSVVRDVSREAIPDDYFMVPDSYRRVEDPMELLGS